MMKIEEERKARLKAIQKKTGKKKIIRNEMKNE